jgi:ABC-2 type transport system permease protein
MGGAIKISVQPNMMRLIDEVRDGKLDHALTKPEDAQVLVSVREVRIWQVVDIVTGLAVLGVGLSRITSDLGALDAISFGAALVLGAAMIYCFWLVIATGAFWVVNMYFVADLFDGVFQTGRWPIGIYPGWLRYSVTFLVPVAFAVTVPAQAVTSRLEWQTLVLAAVFAAALFAFTRWFWRFGLRRYSGASA